MLIRQHYIADSESVGDAETKVFNLNSLKPVTAIDIIGRQTTGVGTTDNTPLPRQISNVSIVDGAFSLVSAIASALLSNQVARGDSLPWMWHEVANAVVNEFAVRILFGRYFGDSEYYLDSSRFINPQLRYTNAVTIHANDYATGTGQVSVVAHVLESGAGPFRGVVMTKEQARPTLGAAGVSSVDLPVDYDYDSILFGATDGITAPLTVLGRAKLGLDADSIIAFDARGADILKQNLMEKGFQDIAADEFDDDAVSLGIGTAPGSTLLRMSALFGGMWMNLGDRERGRFFTIGGHKSMKATLTGGSAGGAVRVITNQIYTK